MIRNVEEIRARRRELRDEYWQYVLGLDKHVSNLQDAHLDFIAANCDRLIKLMQDMTWDWHLPDDEQEEAA